VRRARPEAFWSAGQTAPLWSVTVIEETMLGDCWVEDGVQWLVRVDRRGVAYTYAAGEAPFLLDELPEEP
jgi:hypothetical protein